MTGTVTVPVGLLNDTLVGMITGKLIEGSVDKLCERLLELDIVLPLEAEADVDDDKPVGKTGTVKVPVDLLNERLVGTVT